MEGGGGASPGPRESAGKIRNSGVLAIDTWVEILCINIKLLQNLTWWENDPPQNQSNQLRQTQRVEQLHRLKSQPIMDSGLSPYFLKLPKRNGTYHLIFHQEFAVIPYKG